MNDNKNKFIVAYFSLEIALENGLKTYAGGLGVLAGDLLSSAANLKFPMVGLTLLNRQGYFKQVLTGSGEQIIKPDSDYDFSKLKKLPINVVVNIGQESVKVGVWQYIIKGRDGFNGSVYFLDTDFPENSEVNRRLTDNLYGGDLEYRLKQEIVFGRAGVKMLQALGYNKIKKFHLNEGHGALAAVELFLSSNKKNNTEKVAEVRGRIVFTTHTPLKKEQDVFSLTYLKGYQPDFPDYLNGLVVQENINLTVVGLYFSGYTNAVSNLHQRVTQKMFPDYKIQAITNGVNSLNWASPEFQKLYDKYVPGWRTYNPLLLNASRIPLEEIWAKHQQIKKRLLEFINGRSAVKLEEAIFTLGFARRFTSYKRPEFLFNDLKRLLSLQQSGGRIQIIYAGKAHPRDLEGQELIKLIYQFKKELSSKIKIVFLENYDLDQAKLLTSGVDLWLNTPLLPNEASGTSGMKAAHNGVPQLSTLDGWWPEGYKKNKTGWAIKERKMRNGTSENNLYELLGNNILPLYYKDSEKWKKIMRSTISLNASYFNTDRALEQYIKEAYKLEKLIK
ncbi:MAG: alpha-glucan family phosphorylase [Patescibacteria group bacterium]|jgi:starch phosphorylase